MAKILFVYKKMFWNRSTFSLTFCVFRWVSFKSPSLSVQSNNYPFLKPLISTNQEKGLEFWNTYSCSNLEFFVYQKADISGRRQKIYFLAIIKTPKRRHLCIFFLIKFVVARVFNFTFNQRDRLNGSWPCSMVPYKLHIKTFIH